MSGKEETSGGTGPGAAVALTLAILGLCGCAIGLAFAPYDKFSDPLVLVLVLCVIGTSFVSMDVEGSMFWSGAAIPHVCAFALLGPAPAAAITLVEEVSVWRVDRYRAKMFPINLFGTVAPNMLAAAAMTVVATSADAIYYVTLGAVACGALALNSLLVTWLVGVFYGEPILERLLRYRRFIAPLALNLAVAIAAVALYRSVGMAATIFLLASVLIFAYVTKRLTLEREQTLRISELAASRGRLVAQLLEAEDAERKKLAEILHDEVIQTLLVTRQELHEETLSEPEHAAARNLLDHAIRQLRGTIRATHPSVLERIGLANGLSAVAELYAAHAGFNVRVAVDESATAEHDRLIFSAARELLANASKHAHPANVDVRVDFDGSFVLLQVTDDGCGFTFDPTFARLADGHLGLYSIRERAEAVGGSLAVTSREGDGTEVVVRLPRIVLDESRNQREGGDLPLLTSVGED